NGRAPGLAACGCDAPISCRGAPLLPGRPVVVRRPLAGSAVVPRFPVGLCPDAGPGVAGAVARPELPPAAAGPAGVPPSPAPGGVFATSSDWPTAAGPTCAVPLEVWALLPPPT